MRTLNRRNFTNFRRLYSSSTWKQPTGFTTGVQVYNCVAKTHVPLIVANKNLVSWYTCGPTVYDHAHIGHASCYMRLDILQNILKIHFGLNIVSTMNITDIDDKIITRSQGKKISFTEISKEYEKTFWEDMDMMHIPQPDKILRVTENMNEIIEFIRQLLADGFAYKGGDGSIYFDVKKYQMGDNFVKKYGKMQNLGDRDEDDKNVSKIKKSADDFALWKAAKGGEPYWEANFGPGRPGWHIECSTLASLFYGNTIDIHAGGVDLRFPHHENEEAQSCAYHKCNQWVNYWLHAGHLHLPNAAKMSKSLKNTISIRDLLQTCDPTTFRMVCLLTNYKNHMEFSHDHIKQAEAQLKTIRNFTSDASNLIAKNAINISTNSDVLVTELTKAINEIDGALCRDFDTPAAIKSLANLISTCNKVIHNSATAHTNKINSYNSFASLLAVVNYVHDICKTFGLKLNESEMSDNRGMNEVMDVLVNFRHQLRTLSLARKDREGLALCDDVRNECKRLGIALKDSARVSTWNKL